MQIVICILSVKYNLKMNYIYFCFASPFSIKFTIVLSSKE